MRQTGTCHKLAEFMDGEHDVWPGKVKYNNLSMRCLYAATSGSRSPSSE